MSTIFTPWIGYEKVITIKADGDWTFIRYLCKVTNQPIGQGEWVKSSRIHGD